MDGMMKNEDKTIFDLKLVQFDRLGNILYILGIIFAWLSSNQTERSIIKGQRQQLSSQGKSAFIYDTSKLLALANWVYLAAGIIFLGISYARLEEDKASISNNASLPDKERILGEKMVSFGNASTAIGYALTAAGFEIIAGSTQVETSS